MLACRLGNVYDLNVASLYPKKIGGKTYWYLREMARVDGKPRMVSERYVGSAAEVAALHDLAAGLAPVLGDGHDDWLHARLADLDAGDIEALVTETTRLPLDGNTAKALAYFKTNAHRMRYAYFREHGMFIGSGTVEAGCKPSLVNDSNCPACAGTSPAPPASSPSDANKPATASSTSGHGRLRAPRAADRLRCRASCGYASPPTNGFRVWDFGPYPRARCRDCIEKRCRPGGRPPCRS